MSWVERELEEWAAKGHFDNLPGTGLPIADLDQEYSPGWWAARWVARDRAKQGMAELRSRVAADVAAALELPLVEARARLVQIADAVASFNENLDSDMQLPAVDVDTVLIRREWSA